MCSVLCWGHFFELPDLQQEASFYGVVVSLCSATQMASCTKEFKVDAKEMGGTVGVHANARGPESGFSDGVHASGTRSGSAYAASNPTDVRRPRGESLLSTQRNDDGLRTTSPGPSSGVPGPLGSEKSSHTSGVRVPGCSDMHQLRRSGPLPPASSAKR